MPKERIYTPWDLPEFVPGTSGFAYPTPETRIACPVPAGVTSILAPWEQQRVGPDHWHVVVELNMPPEKVTYWPEAFPAGMPRHDEYGNDEVTTTFFPKRVVPYGADARADLLYTTYRNNPGNLRVFEIERTVPVVILGKVEEAVLFHTAESREGDAARVPAGSYLLCSPLRPDRCYFNAPEKFQKLYGERIFEGVVPGGAIQITREAWRTHGF